MSVEGSHPSEILASPGSDGLLAAMPEVKRPPGADGPAAAALRVSGLAKSFGATRALRSCSFALAPGEVHAIIGENGTGKSTMVKILTGAMRPDQGSIEIAGRELPSFPHPKAAIRAGIAGVFQNVMVVGAQSVLDNLWLGTDGLIRRGVEESVRRARGAEVLGKLLASPPPLDVPAETLALSERQACAIARALLRDPNVLILDEATSALDVETRDRLFAILRRLATQGSSTIFISHRMDEIEEIGDSITVMRAGETVRTLNRGDVSSRELVRLMTGSEHLPEGKLLQPERAGVVAEPVLSARRLILTPGGDPVEVTIRPGELVGLAGLEGHGQDRFLHALAGVRPLGGEVLVAGPGGVIRVRSRSHATAHGIAYVPRDRQVEGVFETLSIRDNFALPTLSDDRRGGLISHRRSGRRLSRYIDLLSIKLSDPRHAITTLSGGNQQKVVLARWLALNPRVLLLNDPTRGIDPGAKHDLYRLLVSLTSQGIAVVMLSTDLDELLDLTHRVLVFREGTIFTEIAREGLTRDGLVASFFGRKEV